jgi:hypothetical protein
MLPDATMRAALRGDQARGSRGGVFRWPSPADPKEQADVSAYRGHQILYAKDDPDSYIQQLIAAL